MGTHLRVTVLAAAAALALAACDPAITPWQADVSYQDADFVAMPAAERTPAPPPRALDIYRPDPAPANAPVIVYVPGGGWAAQNKRHTALPGGFQHYLDLGFVFVSIDYTHTDRDAGPRWPAHVEDVDRAVRWVRHNAAALGVDPHRVVLAGQSAGAHLAAMQAIGAFPDPALPPSLAAESGRPDGLVLMSGPFDLEHIDLSGLSCITVNGTQVCNGDPLRNLLGCDYEPSPTAECLEALRSASPMADRYRNEVAALPPTFVAVSVDDQVVPAIQGLGFAAQICPQPDDPSQPGDQSKPGPETHFEPVAGSDHEIATLPTGVVDQFLRLWQTSIPRDDSARASYVCPAVP